MSPTTTTEFTPVEHVVNNVWTGFRDRIEAKTTDMNKRLAKLGAPAATVEFGPVVEVSDTDPVTGFTRRWTEFETVTVTGSAAKYAGWTPIASLDHTFVTAEGDDEAWVSMFPGAIENEIELPTEFRTIGRGCDHCGTDRKRKTTVVFLSDDGEWINVGTSCLRDFIGITPATILWLSRSFAAFDDEDEFRMPAEAFEPDVTDILTIAAAVTTHAGFIPSRELGSTKEAVIEMANGKIPKGHPLHHVDVDWAAAKATAEDVKTWVLEEAETSRSDYIANAALAIRANRAPYRSIGLLASLPHVFLKNRAEAAEKAAIEAARPDGSSGKHVGEIGDKLVLNVHIVKRIAVETMYGTSLRVSGVTLDGDKVTTFGSGSTLWDVEVDDIVEWRGTVKAHHDNDYGIETEFARVKILDLPTDVDAVRVASKGDKVKITLADDVSFRMIHELETPREAPDGWVYDATNRVLYAEITKVGKRDDRFIYTTNAPVGLFRGDAIEVIDHEFPVWSMTDAEISREIGRHYRPGDDLDDELFATLSKVITKWYAARNVEATDTMIADALDRYIELITEEGTPS